MTEDTTGAASLLDAIENATKETLKEIQGRIESTERQLASLRAAEQLVAASLGVEIPKRGPGGRRTGQRRSAVDGPSKRTAASTGDASAAVPADGDGESSSEQMNDRRRAVYRYLMHNGITKQSVLSEDLHIPIGSMTAVLNHKWFTVQRDGVELAK